MIEISKNIDKEAILNNCIEIIRSLGYSVSIKKNFSVKSERVLFTEEPEYTSEGAIDPRKIKINAVDKPVERQLSIRGYAETSHNSRAEGITKASFKKKNRWADVYHFAECVESAIDKGLSVMHAPADLDRKQYESFKACLCSKVNHVLKKMNSSQTFWTVRKGLIDKNKLYVFVGDRQLFNKMFIAKEIL